MRFLEPVGFLHNNGNGNINHHSTATRNINSTADIIAGPLLTTNGNHHRIQTISQQQQQQQQQEQQQLKQHHNLNQVGLLDTTNTYFDEDNPNVTITSDTVAFTKNNFNENRTINYNSSTNSNTNRVTKAETTDNHQLTNINILSLQDESLGNNLPNDNDNRFVNHLNNDESRNFHVKQIDKNTQNCNTNNSPYRYGNSNGNVICRENLAKLDLNTNTRHRITCRGGRGGSSVCSESSPDDSFMDEDDAYSPSPSSCISLNSPEINYPRGIINPNYPGFQHLAHTLSEHFVDHHFEHSSDSDVSEFELELSKKNSPSDLSIHNVNNNNNCDNNNSEENLDRLEKLLKSVFVSKETILPAVNDNKIDDIKKANIERSAEKLYPQQENQVHSSHNEQQISCDLNTYLKSFEPTCNLEHLKCNNETSNQQKFSTPDILIKNNIRYQPLSRPNIESDDQHEQPDILKNVNDSDIKQNQQFTEDDSGDCVQCVESVERSENRKETPWSITPVDIVGNFKQEIEREFGLIVSGYRKSATTETVSMDGCDEIDVGLTKDCSYENGETDVVVAVERSVLHKMTDAALSNAKETIVVSSTIDDGLASASDADESKKIPIELSDEKQRVINSDKNVMHEIIATTSSIAANAVTVVSNSTTGTALKKVPNSIPTAIVKPKYQRLSYDDRQLPSIVCIDREKSWFDNNQHLSNNNHYHNNNNNVSVASRKIQLPHFDRRKKLSSATSARTICVGSGNNAGIRGIVSEKEKLNSLRLCEKDIDSTTVAIVQPRKKDKMDHRMAYNSNGSVVVDSYANDNKGIKCSKSKASSLSGSGNGSSGGGGGGGGGSGYTPFGSNKSISNNNNNNNNNTSITRPKASTNEKVKDTKEITASFDVYNIETALPVIDLEAIENHLRAAKEEERRKRNDREEIRRRLAMGSEDDYFEKIATDKPGRKPSLHSRLQNGMNLQICFMNETASDTESSSSNSESCPKLSKSQTFTSNSSSNSSYTSRYSTSGSHHPYNSRPLSVNIKKSHSMEKTRPTSLPIGPKVDTDESKEIDFFTKQARLQIEARMALAQAKDIAHMQMEMDRQKLKQSPITEIIRNSLEKVGVPLPPEKRRVSRQMLTDMNIAQLQVIVNELHTQIERLNENLVQYLMNRDDLHMSQDSMLVDIEDLTRYLGAKEQRNEQKQNYQSTTTTVNSSTKLSNCSGKSTNKSSNHLTNRPHSQSKFLRIASLVKK